MSGVPRLRSGQVHQDHAGSDSGGCHGRPADRLKGRGGAGENGGAAGDLYVIVHVRPHPIFGRKGDNLTLTAPVTFQEAALGAEIEVPTLGGQPVKLRLSPGTPNGRTLRVRGKVSASATARRATCWSPSRCWCPRRSMIRPERH